MSCSLLATKLQLLLESAVNCCRLQQMSRELAANSMNAELAADCCCLLPAASLAVGSTIDNHTLHVAAAAARVGSKKYEPCLRQQSIVKKPEPFKIYFSLNNLLIER